MGIPPRATIVGSESSFRAFFDRLARPPSWASSIFAWACSGAFAGAAGNVFATLARAGALDDIRLLGSLGIVAGSLVAMIGLVIPFLVSGGLYLLLIPRRTPGAGALWNVLFHGGAHLVVVSWFLGAAWHANLEVPVVIGALWGLWLPRAANPEDLPMYRQA